MSVDLDSERCQQTFHWPIRRERFLLPSCACHIPPGIGETIPDVASCAVQTVSEEGPSHLADDGWAEAQERVKSICTQLVDLSVAVDAIPNRVSSDVADLFTVVLFQS